MKRICVVAILFSLLFLFQCRVRITTNNNCEEKKRNLQVCLLIALNSRDADKIPLTLSCQELYQPGFGCD
ncbi:hypothetical protein EHQ23_02965 [Leptospira bourretii]|uniref:Uncharacterized protein n=1 Tax=Leptospira bourretii TaxID=2484962 RepID=A0A4R9IQW0_9LEPT|nr:hypothetical protein [Leptospira bourretii]TGK89364.1 hypothetical protein EHQ23_02965 [Leptospira bourretii]TGK93468.1 hypothetical protein EHQ26_05380 [Leptospira bourretii]TGL18401.1 hypothetical protein EHQ47_17880 [Leptospira bourretii]TGL39938.1 hypothetical protein EHQ45_03635 [Leptospira bourretii]